MCFSSERHEEIKKVERNKSPVRLQHFRTSTSYGQEDIVILDHSTVTTITPTDGLVFSDKFQPQSVDGSIAGLSNVAAEQLVSLKAFVAEISPVKRITTRNGSSLRKQEVYITDTGSSIKLVVLWEDYVDSLERNKTYKFQDLRLKVSKVERYLNTPKSEKCHFEQTIPFLGNLVTVDHHVANLSKPVISADCAYTNYLKELFLSIMSHEGKGCNHRKL